MYDDTGSPFPAAASQLTRSCPPPAATAASPVGAEGTDADVEYTPASLHAPQPISLHARTRNAYTCPGVSFAALSRTAVAGSDASVTASHAASSPGVPRHICTSYAVMSCPHPLGATQRILSAVRVRDDSTGGAGHSGGDATVLNTPFVSNMVSAPWQGTKLVRAIASTRYSRPGASPLISQRKTPSSPSASRASVATLR